MEPLYLPEFQDIRWRWIAYGGSAIVLAGIVFAFCYQVELKQDVRCEIVSAAEIKVKGQGGLVSAIYVQAPTHVEAGQPLYRLERDYTLARDGTQRTTFDAKVRDEQRRAADALYAQRRVDLESQLATARASEVSRGAELGELVEQEAQGRQLVEESKRKLTRLDGVSDYVVADRIEQARVDLHQNRIAAAQAAAQRQQTLIALADSRNQQTALAAQLKELDAAHARDLREADARFEETRRDVTISAPTAGTVTFSRLVQGATLQPSDIAMVIVTDESQPLRAELRIPSRRRGFVREGQTVRIKFDAFPYARFGTYEARIDSISRTTVSQSEPMPGVESEEGAAVTDRVDQYVAWVTLRGHAFDYGKEHFDILPGMQATGSIVVERRTIAEWVLEPLYKIARG